MAKRSATESKLTELDPRSTAALVSAAADVTLVVDRHGVIRKVEVATEPAPVATDGGVGSAWAETVTAETRGKVHALLREVAASGVSARRQVNHLSADGDIPISYTAVGVSGDGDVIAIGRDMRAVAALQQRLVETQQALERDYWRMRHVETRYRLLFQLSAEAVLVVDATSRRVVEANAAAAALFGVPAERLHGRTFPGGVAPAHARTLEELLAGARSAGRSPDVVLDFGADHGEARVSASCFRQEADTLFLVRFVTGPASAAETADPDQLPPIVEAMPDGFVVAGVDGLIRRASRGFLDIVQLASEEQVRGRPVGDWIGRPGADFPVFVAMLKKHGVMRLVSTAARGEHGALSEVEVSAAWLPDAPEPTVGLVLRDVGRRVAVGPQGARDLARAVEQLTGLLGRVSLADLVRDTTDLVERHFIAAALDMTDDNRTAAAEVLGLSRQSLYNKLRRQSITAQDAAFDATFGGGDDDPTTA